MKYHVLAGALVLAGCASMDGGSNATSMIGKTVVEAQAAYGMPAQVTDLPDGRKAFLYRPASVREAPSGRATSDAQHGAVSSYANGSGGGATVDAGCLVTLIAADHGNGYVVEEYLAPTRGARNCSA